VFSGPPVIAPRSDMLGRASSGTCRGERRGTGVIMREGG
jgi:hypothetical protein